MAAVQTRPRWGDVPGNLGRATELIEEAARQGARVAVLPEMSATGYQGTRETWSVAEAMDGRIGTWLVSTARRLEIVLGCGLPERVDGDCYNAFLWAGPDGRLLGSTRKAVLSERWAFRPGPGSHVAHTPVGVIGTGICADNQRFSHLATLAESGVELVAMPHAAPMFAEPSSSTSAAEVAAQRERMASLPVVYATALGVPVIFANQVGPMLPIAGIAGRLMRSRPFRLLGLSRVVDSDGRVVATLESDEGVAVGDVVLDPARRTFRSPAHPGGTLFPVPAIMRAFLMPVDASLGAAWYSLHRTERRRRMDSTGAAL